LIGRARHCKSLQITRFRNSGVALPVVTALQRMEPRGVISPQISRRRRYGIASPFSQEHLWQAR
jgi:hypothetical protein